MKKSISSLLFVLLAGGCAASGSARYSASATTPRLVYVSAGVQVIEDYDEPIFYSSNMYWRYDGGVWYQSRYHTSGWVRVSSPPAPILRIERPAMYVHYRSSAHANAASQRAEDKREMKEDKREMKEDKREMKEERREAQQEKREDKREEKQEKQEKREDKQEAKDAGKPGNDSHKPSKK
jgi:hypothetical protein